MNLKKAKDIGKAFVNPLPVGEDWYEKRIEICRTCPKNTNNVEDSKLSFVDKAKIKTGLCDNGNHCLACGCCIERKCSLKSEVCGLKELGEEPKWNALEVESKRDKRLKVENLSPGVCNLSMENGEYIVEFLESSDLKLSLSIKISRSNGLEVKSHQASCGCTLANMETVDKTSAIFNLDISTKKFKEGLNTRNFSVTYFENLKKTLDINFKLKINKI